MPDKLVVGESYTTDELLKMFPVENGNVFIGFPELEGEERMKLSEEEQILYGHTYEDEL